MRSVARIVYYESLRQEKREAAAAEIAPAPRAEEPDSERSLQALDTCLETLPPEDRQLILDYHAGPDGSNITARRRLAARLGLSATALRIRAHRLRTRLERCVRGSSAPDEP